jgi:LytS/YehU family sensor histidine kinase
VIHGDYSAARIAPMILIQFIENAFKFGIKLEKESEILISLNISDHNLEFNVKNPIFINPVNTLNKASGIGIENVKKRLEILYPGKHELIIEDKGNFFNVRLFMNLNQK